MVNFEDALKSLQGTIPVPVIALAKLLGISVYATDDLRDDESGLIKKEHDRYVIYVNQRHPATRQRFTIAHEIAHFVKHKDRLDKGEEHIDGITQSFLNGGPSPALYRAERVLSEEEQRLESEANTLAAQILMPEEEFIKLFRTATSIEEVADAFAVSPAAATVRAKTLLGQVLL